MIGKGCTGGITQTERDRGKEAGGRKKVCAVRYADESVMASMQEWTQPVPQDHTHQPKHTHTHRMAHQRAHKPTLEIENTDT